LILSVPGVGFPAKISNCAIIYIANNYLSPYSTVKTKHVSGVRLELTIFGLLPLSGSHTEYETDALPTEPTRRPTLVTLVDILLENVFSAHGRDVGKHDSLDSLVK
jgi:hypothetical protein